MRLEELRRLPGVTAFPVTPFKPDLSLDIAGLRRTFFSLYNIPSPQSSRRRHGRDVRSRPCLRPVLA